MAVEIGKRRWPGSKAPADLFARELGKKLDLRFVPAIEFLYDDSEEEARRIDALLDKVKELKRKIEGFLSDFIS